MRIPTIDLSDGPAPVAGEVGRACAQVGFLTVVGHGVASRLIDEVARRSRAFFDRPDGEKDRFAAPATKIGLPVYRPLGAERLGGSVDRKASLDWGPSLVGVGWPGDELRAAYERYYGELLRVADVLVRAFALAMGLPEDALASFFDDRSSSMRVIDYPAGAGRGDRAAAHRDYGCLTIIHSDAGGLQAQTRDGDWLPVGVPDGGFVVNIGDLMQRWTGDRWISTLHRVVGERDAPRRQSLVFFHNPRNDAVITTLGDGTSYEPVAAGEYVLSRAAAAGL